jgi:integrase
VVRNVAALADPPTVGSRKSTQIKAWDAPQLLVFLAAIAEHRFAPLFHLAANTGMRRGELLGLRWSDIDVPAKRLSVQQALVSVAYKVELADVKTDHGRRTIDLDDATLQVLEEWRQVRTSESGSALAPGGLVFVKADGTSPHPDIVSQVFDRKVAKLDVPVITMHDLRHTHATLLLKAGVPVKVVSERLGHSTPAFTMSVYQHVLPGMQAEAAATFARLLGR